MVDLVIAGHCRFLKSGVYLIWSGWGCKLWDVCESLAGGCPAASYVSFASPKESNQRKGDLYDSYSSVTQEFKDMGNSVYPAWFNWKERTMPWKEVKPMDEKVLFIADSLREVDSFSQLCQRYGISRKTGYKWLARYREQGADGLSERSRRPQSCADTTPFVVQQAILEMRGIGSCTRSSRGTKPRFNMFWYRKTKFSPSTNTMMRLDGFAFIASSKGLLMNGKLKPT